ncbi:hypothetical protein PR048_007757 [Dryococelus australis]|uniref:Integrase catalytic domain-containing protein n=1 Tax=Dryococelus australis TaxID=614101 RepID=A0ABQ9HV54_9NEOP|nr:hypothetical protein PR048_007757 [Dryococelus australis]
MFVDLKEKYASDTTDKHRSTYQAVPAIVITIADRWRKRRHSSALSCVTGKVHVTPSSVSEKSLNEVKASTSMPRRRQRAPHQHMSEFERGRMIGLRETGLSYCDISARTGHAATTVMRVWHQWIEEGATQRRAGTGPRNMTTARDDRHISLIVVTQSTASSTVLARHWSTALRVDLYASTVRRRELRAELVARISLRRLPLSRNHKRLRLQCARERRRWRADPASTCPTLMPVYVLDATVVTAIWQPALWSSIVEKRQVTLNCDRCIREVLEPGVLPFLQATPRAIFQQDNTRPNVARNVQAFFNKTRVPLFIWPARSPDMSFIENVWDMVGRRLVRHGPPTTTVDALWTRTKTNSLEGDSPGTYPQSNLHDPSLSLSFRHFCGRRVGANMAQGFHRRSRHGLVDDLLFQDRPGPFHGSEKRGGWLYGSPSRLTIKLPATSHTLVFAGPQNLQAPTHSFTKIKVKAVHVWSSAGMKGRENESPRENPATSGIVRHDSHMRKSGCDPVVIEPADMGLQDVRRHLSWTHNHPFHPSVVRPSVGHMGQRMVVSQAVFEHPRTIPACGNQGDNPRTRELMRVRRGEYGAPPECKGNGTGEPRHDSRVRKSGSHPAGNRNRFVVVGGECYNHFATATESHYEKKKGSAKCFRILQIMLAVRLVRSATCKDHITAKGSIHERSRTKSTVMSPTTRRGWSPTASQFEATHNPCDAMEPGEVTRCDLKGGESGRGSPERKRREGPPKAGRDVPSVNKAVKQETLYPTPTNELPTNELRRRVLAGRVEKQFSGVQSPSPTPIGFNLPSGYRCSFLLLPAGRQAERALDTHPRNRNKRYVSGARKIAHFFHTYTRTPAFLTRRYRAYYKKPTTSSAKLDCITFRTSRLAHVASKCCDYIRCRTQTTYVSSAKLDCNTFRTSRLAQVASKCCDYIRCRTQTTYVGVYERFETAYSGVLSLQLPDQLRRAVQGKGPYIFGFLEGCFLIGWALRPITSCLPPNWLRWFAYPCEGVVSTLIGWTLWPIAVCLPPDWLRWSANPGESCVLCSRITGFQHWNEREGETEDPRENSSTSGIVRHDSHLRKTGVNRPELNPHALYDSLHDIHGDSSPFPLQPFHELSNGFWPCLTSPRQAIRFATKKFYRLEVGALGGPVQSANIVVGTTNGQLCDALNAGYSYTKLWNGEFLDGSQQRVLKDDEGETRWDCNSAGKSPRKPTDHWHHPARFLRAKIHERPHLESNQVRSGRAYKVRGPGHMVRAKVVGRQKLITAVVLMSVVVKSAGHAEIFGLCHQARVQNFCILINSLAVAAWMNEFCTSET